MNCDPNALMEAAKCFRCIPAGEQLAIKIYLLCQWENNLGVCEVHWTPENAIASWNDASGGHVGDWNAFSATADVSTVTSLDMTAAGIDSLTGLECMPLLNDLRISQNALTGTLDLSVCPLLAFVECGVNQLTGLDVSGLVNLLFLDAGVNLMSTAAINTILIDLDTNGAINGQADLNAQTPSAPPSQVGRNAAANLIGNGWALTLDEINWAPATEVFSWTDGGGANAGNLAFFLANADFDTVTDFQSPGGGLVTSLTGLQGLISLSTLSASGEAIVAFDGRRMLSISGVAIGNNPNLTTLTFTAVTSLTSLSCFNSVVTTLVLTGCTSLTNLDCQFNAGLTAITGIGTCTALVAIDCNTCDIPGTLDVSGLANLTTVNCSANANLTGLDLTGCTSLNQLLADGCNINPTLDLSGLASLSIVNVTGNPNLNSVVLTGCVSISQFRSSGCNLGSLNVGVSAFVTYLDCADNFNLSSLNIGSSVNYTNVYAYGCALPDTPNGVNEALINLETNCLGNAGDVDLDTAATNAAPSGAGALAKVNLIGNGWAIQTN